MAIVTAVNALMSMRVGALIGAISETYLPAYGMLARSHIRALEQSSLLRRAVLSEVTESANSQQSDDLLAAADAAGADAEAELANAHSTIAKHVNNHFDFEDQVLLGRLEAQIEAINQ